MFVSYFEPLYLRQRCDLYIPYFYKQIQEFDTDDIIYLTNEDFFKSPVEWKNRECWNLSTIARKFHRFKIPSYETLHKLHKEFIPIDIFNEILKTEDLIQVEKFLLTNRYKPLEDYFNYIFEKLTKKYNIEGIFTVKNCPSLEYVAKAYNIPVIHYEIAALRPYDYDFLAFFDYAGVNGNTSSKMMYQEFKKLYYEKPIKLLSNNEIIKLLTRNNFNPNNINISQKKFRFGLALQIYNDSNLIAFSNNYDSEKFINYFVDKVQEQNIIIRNHPSSTESKLLSFCNIDKSSKTVEFIKRCERIATINSSVAFEAALYNKPVCIFGESPYEILSENTNDFLYKENINVNTIEKTIKMNFLTFTYMIPYDLLFDINYIRYRLMNPNLIDLYNFHLNYWVSKEKDQLKNTIDKLEKQIKNDINILEKNYKISLNKPTFLQQIFSVKNEESHKVIRILGFKIKFKRNLKTKTINS